MTAILSITVNANPDGPKCFSPRQYSEYKIAAGVEIQWVPPASEYGAVDHYEVAVRKFDLNDDVNNVNAGEVIVRTTCAASTQSYTIKGSDLKKYYYSSNEKKYRKYRISVCAVMKDGTKRWSDHRYFYISTNNTPKNHPISFYIYNGFSQETKEQIYYACQNWNNTLDIGREIVNTYPYSKGTDSTTANTSDGINIVTKKYDESGYLMTTHKRLSTGLFATYELLEADIVVNSRHPWTSSPQKGKFYVYNTIVHEMGHVVGLSDKYDSWASEWTMYGYADMNEDKKTTLAPQDIQNGKGLYK